MADKFPSSGPNMNVGNNKGPHRKTVTSQHPETFFFLTSYDMFLDIPSIAKMDNFLTLLLDGTQGREQRLVRVKL